MLTAAIRDLHRNNPGRFLTDVDTPCQQLWENNPNITKLKWHKEGNKHVADEPSLEFIQAEYGGDYAASIHKSNGGAWHFIHAMAQDLEKKLGVRIPITALAGDIVLSKEEKGWMSQVEETGEKRPFWIIVAGGKTDFTCKWWSPAWYQQVVDHFKDKLLFVQCGEMGHNHQPLSGVLNLVGKTDIRQFVRLVHHSSGILCPVTLAMHLAAAVEDRRGRMLCRPCVVIAGGREPPQWEFYPFHRFLHTMGSLPCCREKACWKSRCQKIGDGDKKDTEDLCERPVKIDGVNYPECMLRIKPDDVIRGIESYGTA